MLTIISGAACYYAQYGNWEAEKYRVLESDNFWDADPDTIVDRCEPWNTLNGYYYKPVPGSPNGLLVSIGGPDQFNPAVNVAVDRHGVNVDVPNRFRAPGVLNPRLWRRFYGGVRLGGTQTGQPGFYRPGYGIRPSYGIRPGVGVGGGIGIPPRLLPGAGLAVPPRLLPGARNGLDVGLGAALRVGRGLGVGLGTTLGLGGQPGLGAGVVPGLGAGYVPGLGVQPGVLPGVGLGAGLGLGLSYGRSSTSTWSSLSSRGRGGLGGLLRLRLL